MSRAAAVAYAICLPLGLIALVFLPVGRLDWKPGWIFVAFLVAAFGASALILARVNPSIYRARRFQPGTKRWDLVLVALIFSAIIIEVPLMSATGLIPTGVNRDRFTSSWPDLFRLVPAIHAPPLTPPPMGGRYGWGQDVDARDIGVSSDAVLRTSMRGHDESECVTVGVTY